MNDGNDGFIRQRNYSTSKNPESVFVVDVNDDKRLDLIVRNFESSSVGIYLGKGNGEFAEERIYSIESVPVEVIPSDIDNDQQLDLLIRYRKSLGILHGDCLKNISNQEE